MNNSSTLKNPPSIKKTIRKINKEREKIVIKDIKLPTINI
tara:strand:- start:13080 stop:13199 length:120 start_codon:yes stop_codon:yes gene_type:complete